MKIIGTSAQQKPDHHLSPEEMMDPRQQQEVRRFRERVEFAVINANREIMAREVPALTEASLVRLAVRVAEQRARYINRAIEVSGHSGPAQPAEIDELAGHRKAYEELAAAFEAGERVVLRGYKPVR